MLAKFGEQMQVIIICAFVIHFIAPSQIVWQGSIH